jgi:cobalt-zinc-cadmium efflux system outer membrane protein
VADARAEAAEAQAALAPETQGFFEQSFRLGETDLPTRLRTAAEAAEAERLLNDAEAL